jgi:hypothetical protein
VTAPVSATPSTVSPLPCTPQPSGLSERRISMLPRDGIGRHGGRPQRPLTGLLVCGLCGAHLRASPRPRHSIEWRPRGLTNEPYAVTWSQPRYVCPTGHLAIIAEPLERLISAAMAEGGEILRVVVAPGRKGCTHFDPYRLRIDWRDPTITRTPLRRLCDQAVLAEPTAYQRP